MCKTFDIIKRDAGRIETLSTHGEQGGNNFETLYHLWPFSVWEYFDMFLGQGGSIDWPPARCSSCSNAAPIRFRIKIQNEKMKLQIQVPEIQFLWKVAFITHCDILQSYLRRCTRNCLLRGDPGKNSSNSQLLYKIKNVK